MCTEYTKQYRTVKVKMGQTRVMMYSEYETRYLTVKVKMGHKCKERISEERLQGFFESEG